MTRTSAITRSTSLVFFAALAVSTACTVSDPPKIGTSLVALGPTLPGTSPTKPSSSLPAKPDLAVTAVEVTRRIGNSLEVCATIRNKGGVAWASNASQVSVEVVVDTATPGRAPGIASVPVGTSVTRCGWVQGPSMIRLGEPIGNECGHKLKASAKLLFDPDFASDSNTANDDSKKTNDALTVEVSTVVQCLI